VLQVVRELGYTRNGQSVPTSTRVLGLLMESVSIPAAHDRFYAEIVAGIEEAAQRLWYRRCCTCTAWGSIPSATFAR
jgi:DNA-binding LacI/PurR family transcriptional regulator